MSRQDEVPKIDLNKLGPPETSEWLLLFYIAGDSMLSASMISQLKQLSDAGFYKDATVLAYFDPNCNGLNARIFNVNHQRKLKKIKEQKNPTIIGDGRDPFAHSLAEGEHIKGLPSMTAGASLGYFLQVATTQFRAKNYMLFLMGHGTIVGNDTFLPDPDDNSAISLVQLGKIMKRFATDVRTPVKGDSKLGTKDFDKGELHLVGFHSCAMNSVELAYELQGTSRYIVGTQGMAFPGSWPYRQLLKKIFCKLERYEGDKSLASARYPNELVRSILSGVQDLSFYNGVDFWQAGYSSDLSMCNLDIGKVTSLDKPLRGLVQALRAGLKTPEGKSGILLAHWESQSYWNESYTDLFDFCERLETYCAYDTAIPEACKAIKDALRAAKHRDFDDLVVYSDYYGPHYQFSHGLSVYFPWARPYDNVMTTYDGYAFTKAFKEPKETDNSWASFLEDYFKLTLRPMRGSTNKPGDTKGSVELPLEKSPALANIEPPPKVPALANTEPPPKVPALANIEPPPKVPALDKTGPPDKPPAMGPPPDKPPSVGSFAATIIKNYFDSDDVFITSRPAHTPARPVGGSEKLISDSDEEREDDEDEPI